MENATFLISLDNYHSIFSMKSTDTRSRPPIVVVLELQAVWEKCEWKYAWRVSDPSQPDDALPDGSGINNKQNSVIALKLQEALDLEGCHYNIGPDKLERPQGLYSTLGEFLYGLENLRKRPQTEQPEEGTEVVGASRLEES